MSNPTIPTRKIFLPWWPLAASSALMSAEMPFVNSAIARTPNAEVAWQAMTAVRALRHVAATT